MNLTEIKKILDENLNKESSDGKERNIVFWHDAEGEFRNDIAELLLDNAKIITLTGNNSFYIKYLIEKEDTESNYIHLLQSRCPEKTIFWISRSTAVNFPRIRQR